MEITQAAYNQFLEAKPRYIRILRLKAQGFPDAEIARLEGVSRQRMWQLLRRIENAQNNGWL